MEEKLTLEELKAENAKLRKKVKDLEKNIADSQTVVDAANKYRAEHTKAIKTLDEAKVRYDQAYKAMLAEKNRYKTEMDELIMALKGRK